MGNCCFKKEKKEKREETGNVPKFRVGNLDLTKGRIHKVIDGDTYWVISNIKNIGTYQFKIRLNGIDTPESRKNLAKNKLELQAGIAVKEYAKGRYEGKQCQIITDKKYDDKYGRVLAQLKVDKEDIGQHLIQLGFALPYEGGEKGWTDNALHEILEVNEALI